MTINSVATSKPGTARRKINYSTWAPLAALIVLVIISAFASPYFLSPRNLLNITRQISYTGIIGLGMTLIIIAGGIDLSVGSLVALAGGIAILALNALGGGLPAVIAAILVAMLIGMLGGALNGTVVTVGRVAPFIVTLGTMSIFRSLTLYFANGGEFRSQSDLFPEFGTGLFLEVPIPTWVFLALAISFHILLTYTPYGRHVCAVGANDVVARYSAIRVNVVKFITYVLTGFTVGVSAVLLASRLNAVSSTNAGVYYELDAIAAVVIGGTSMSGGMGTIWGTVIGAAVLGIINNMLNMAGISPYLQGLVKGLIIIAAVLVQYKRK
jgi:ribose transport system permease protein